jgi:hypothetical protein
MASLLVVGDNCLKKIAEPLVSARIVLSGDLEEQALDLIQAAQPVPRDGICEARPKHDERMLALVFGGPSGAANGVIQTPQGAACTGIEVAHPAYNDVRLIIEIQAIVDQLVEVDFGRAFETAVATGTSTSFAALATVPAGSPATVSSLTAFPSFAATAAISARTLRTVATVAILLLLYLLFSHVYPVPFWKY